MRDLRYLSSNGLRTLDLSIVPNLTALNCGGNQLTELDLRTLRDLMYLDLKSSYESSHHIRIIQRPDQNFK